MFLMALLFTLIGSASPTAPVVLFLGDSLTEGYGISQNYAYPKIIENKLKAKYPAIKVINAGISGSTSASAESRLRWQLKNKPDILFLALGANDGLRGLDVNSMRANLEKTIILAKKEKMKIILAGMKIPMNYGVDYRLKYEAVFTDLAKKHGVVFIPFLLEGVAANRAYNIPDGIHPNEKGHEIMAKNILPVIEKTLKELKAK